MQRVSKEIRKVVLLSREKTENLLYGGEEQRIKRSTDIHACSRKEEEGEGD